MHYISTHTKLLYATDLKYSLDQNTLKLMNMNVLSLSFIYLKSIYI
jgi:hypothetical protein